MSRSTVIRLLVESVLVRFQQDANINALFIAIRKAAVDRIDRRFTPREFSPEQNRGQLVRSRGAIRVDNGLIHVKAPARFPVIVYERAEIY